MMRALRHRVSLLTLTPTDDGEGGQTNTWAVAAQLWAAWEPKYGGEFLQAGAVQSALRHRVTVRYRTDLTVKSRIRREPHGPTCEVHQLESVEQRDRYLVLEVVERDD